MYRKTLLLCLCVLELVSADFQCDLDLYNWYRCTGVQLDNFPLTNPHGSKVTALMISDSSMREIPENAFIGLPSIQTLYLRGNHLESVADGAFNGLPNLRFLHLELNDLTSLSLSGMPGLRTLVMWKNKISSLDLKLDDLSLLDISFNLITNLTFVEHLPKLERLDVRDNRLSCVDEDIFQDLPALVDVFLGDNPWQRGCGTSLATYFEARNVTVRDINLVERQQ